MADELTAGGVRVYRDTGGVLREVPQSTLDNADGGGTPATLPDQFKVVQVDDTGTFDLDLTSADLMVEIVVSNSQGVFGADITGLTGSGATVVAESTVGSIWLPVNMARVGGGGALPMTATEDSSWRSSVVAKTKIRLRVSVAGTGTATVCYSLSTNSSLVQLSAPLPPGGNLIGRVILDGMAQGGQAPNGMVTVANFPALQAVTGTFWQVTQPVSGSVSVDNFPATQAVSGTVAVTQSGAWSFAVSTLPAITGSVSVSNFPATQAVSGTVSLAAGNNALGSVSVSSLPAITGAVSVSNFPATQVVSGVVSVSNLPAVQQVADNSGSLTVDTGTAGVFAPTPTGAAGFAIVPQVASGVASLLVKNSAGNLYSASVIASTNAAAFYLIALNRATVPAANAAITQAEMLGCQYIFAGSYGTINPDDIPDRFSTGIVLICSTSTTTYTPITAANILHLKARAV